MKFAAFNNLLNLIFKRNHHHCQFSTASAAFAATAVLNVVCLSAAATTASTSTALPTTKTQTQTSTGMKAPVVNNKMGMFQKMAVASSAGGSVVVEKHNDERPDVLQQQHWRHADGDDGVLLFVCGDVMTGRGIDQILPHPSKPQLFEPCVRDARDYVRLAERVTGGPLTKIPVDFAYPWSDALTVLEEMKPDVRIINLETSVTSSDKNWPDKGIHYRMHPDNVPCLCSARPDCCVLANNHVLDWGFEGLNETLDVLHTNGIRTSGAGRNAIEATAPAVIEVGNGHRLNRVLVYAVADESSGVPNEWAATGSRSGINFLPNGISTASADAIVKRIEKERRPDGGDIVVLSIHWGGNWGYHITRTEREFAHRLIDSGMVDIVHGHSSHHAKAVEIYKSKLIMYGCGDFLNDYEGISGQEEFHDEFTLMYFPLIDPRNGKLLRMLAIPMQIEHMRLNRGSEKAATFLYATMKRECAKFGTLVERDTAEHSTKNAILFRSAQNQ